MNFQGFRLNKKAAVFLGVLLSGFSANASSADIFWNGFASFTGGLSLDEAVRADGESLYLYSYEDKLSFRPESKLALQATSKLGDGFSVTAQAMARGADSFNVQMEWAFLSYDFGDASRLNIGKIRIPFYQYSDYLDVGQTYHWVRTPDSIYDLFIDSMEGASLQTNYSLNEWELDTQFVIGETENSLLIGGIESEGKVTNSFGGVVGLKNEWLSFRLAYFETEVTITNSALESVVNNFTALGYAEQARAFETSEDKGTFFGFGSTLQKGGWFAGIEYTQVRVDSSFIGDLDASYLTVGKRVGSFTYHATYEIEDNTHKQDVEAGIPYPTSTGLDILVDTVVAVNNSSHEDSTTYTLGVRYDVSSSVALKTDLALKEYDGEATLQVDGSSKHISFSLDVMF